MRKYLVRLAANFVTSIIEQQIWENSLEKRFWVAFFKDHFSIYLFLEDQRGFMIKFVY